MNNLIGRLSHPRDSVHNLCDSVYNLRNPAYNLRSFVYNLRNRDRNLRTPILKRAFLEPNNDSAIGGFPSIWRAATNAGKARYQTPVRRFAFKLRRFTPLPTCSHRSAVRQLRSRCPLLRGFVLFRRSAASLTLPSSAAASLTLPRRSAASFTLFRRPSVTQPPSHRHITPLPNHAAHSLASAHQPHGTGSMKKTLHTGPSLLQESSRI